MIKFSLYNLEFYWQTYILNKVLLIIEKMKLKLKKEFIVITLSQKRKIFIVNIVSFINFSSNNHIFF